MDLRGVEDEDVGDEVDDAPPRQTVHPRVLHPVPHRLHPHHHLYGHALEEGDEEDEEEDHGDEHEEHVTHSHGYGRVTLAPPARGKVRRVPLRHPPRIGV
jgi:hypothetical protein